MAILIGVGVPDRLWAAATLDERKTLADVPHRLIGRRLREVRYFDINYGEAGPLWRASGFHSLDFGLELDVDDPPETWSVTWKMAGDVEALLLYSGPLVGEELSADGDYGRFDVTGEEPWSPCVGQAVSAAEFVQWEQYGSVAAPDALRLAFDTGEVLVVLGASADDGGFRGSADGVSVFPSIDAARKLGAIRS